MFERRRPILLAGLAAACLAIAAGPAFAQTSVDPSVRPGDDFYGYANNVWLRATVRPDDQPAVHTISLLRAQNAQRAKDIITAAAVPRRTSASSLEAKVGDYFATRLDTAGIEARGMAPLAGDLAAIARIGDRRALATYLGRTVRLDDGGNQRTESLWGVWIHQGFQDPARYAAHLVQGGLGLPQPQDYLDQGPDARDRRALYREHVATVLAAAGLDQPDVRAARVVDLEIAIAQTHAPRSHTDDVLKIDNNWRLPDFAVRAPGFDWATYFAAAGLDRAPGFVVWQPTSVVGGARLAAEQPLAAWKDYLAFHLVAHYSAVLPKAIRDERRAFEARLAGVPAPPAPQPEPAAIAATEQAMGYAVSQLYVERYFPPAAKQAAVAMGENLRAAYRTRIANLGWMSPPTKARALEKLAALRLGLGYPDRWPDSSGLEIVRGDAFGNLRRAEASAYASEVAKLQQPMDPGEWTGLLPHRPGAILDLSPNGMRFSAGILQPPFFDPAGDLAANYGSAGAGMAHEIGHSFDKVGDIYDSQGRLVRRWWEPSDLAAFDANAARLAAQLQTCCPSPDLCARAEQVLGESLADIGGLQVAYDAYQLALGGKPDVVLNGLTGDQRFFIAFAQRWRRLQSDAAARQQVASDNHAPPQCRSNLARNVDAWYRAFDVRPGDKLYLPPEDRVRVW